MQFFKHIIVALLTLESRLILAKYKPYIVAVTGSVGKTSTKDAIYSVLKGSSPYVRKSEKSLNSEIGLPLTVIGVPNAWKSLSGWMRNLLAGLKLIIFRTEYPDTLIVEIGADHPGDIRRVASWLQADVVVITQVSSTPVHVEFFASPEEVFEEKASLAGALKKGGALILFADNPKVMTIAERVKELDPRVISFGTVDTASVRGVNGHITYADNALVGFGFDIIVDGAPNPVYLTGIVGRAYMYPLLAAAAVGRARNITTEAIVRNIQSYDAPKGRMNIIPGMNGSTIIDDTYNSSPEASLVALETLKSAEVSGRRIAVLGDMLELGQYAAEEHRRIGREVRASAALLVTVGQRSRATADEALSTGMSHDDVRSFDLSTEAADYLRTIVGPGDLILVKGSQSIRMERVVSALMRDPSRAGELLVRQEKEWLEKK